MNSLVITSPKWRPSIDETPVDSHQRMSKLIRKNSHSDEPISPFTHPNHLSRLSLRSISYGFGLGTKTRKNIPPDQPIAYHLPSNKIELDLTQQELIRRTGSFKTSI